MNIILGIIAGIGALIALTIICSTILYIYTIKKFSKELTDEFKKDDF